MAASRSIAVLLVSLWVMELAVAWPQMISKSKIVCKEFHVAHGRASIDIRNTDVLAVNLLNEKGEPVACVEPNRKSYTRKCSPLSFTRADSMCCVCLRIEQPWELPIPPSHFCSV